MSHIPGVSHRGSHNYQIPRKGVPPSSRIHDAGEDENAIPLVQSKSHNDNGKGGFVASSKNEKSRPRSRSRGSSPASGMFRKWWGELSCCLLVLAALLAIVATLYPYADRPLPRWPYGLSINALLSIWVLIMKAAMLYLISQGMPPVQRPHASL